MEPSVLQSTLHFNDESSDTRSTASAAAATSAASAAAAPRRVFGMFDSLLQRPVDTSFSQRSSTTASASADYLANVARIFEAAIPRIAEGVATHMRSAANVVAATTTSIHQRAAAAAAASAASTGPHHSGLMCDGCRGQIFGNRYKCTACADFDFCQTCMDSQPHAKSHNFLLVSDCVLFS